MVEGSQNRENKAVTVGRSIGETNEKNDGPPDGPRPVKIDGKRGEDFCSRHLLLNCKPPHEKREGQEAPTYDHRELKKKSRGVNSGTGAGTYPRKRLGWGRCMEGP